MTPPDIDEQAEEIMRTLRIGNPDAAERLNEDDIKEWIREGDPLQTNMQRVSQKLRRIGS